MTNEDPGTVLRDQQRQIRQDVEVVATAAPGERHSAFERFAATLEAHAGYIASAVYPVIAAAAEDAATIVDARSTEESAIASQMTALGTSDSSTSQWLADFTVLVAELNAHLAAEENTVLPLVDKVSRT